MRDLAVPRMGQRAGRRRLAGRAGRGRESGRFEALREPAGGAGRLGFMRLIGLVAALIGFAAAFADVDADAGERLGIEVETDRGWCTAGSLVLATWTAAGGEPPYAYTVQGREIAASEYRSPNSEYIDCAALRAAGGEPAAWGEMTVRVEVIDAAGSRASGERRVLLAPPLPAPTGLHLRPDHVGFSAHFDLTIGAGSLAKQAADDWLGAPYMLRYRTVGDPEWQYKTGRERFGEIEFEPERGVVGEMQLAALRRGLENRRPEALNWSEAVRYVASERARGKTERHPGEIAEAVAVTATGDRIEVRAVESDGYGDSTLELRGADGAVSAEYGPGKQGEWLVTHYAEFEGLSPDQAYTLRLPSSVDEPTALRITTTAAAVEPLALRLSSASESCTDGTETGIRWRVSGGAPPYEINVAGRSAEGREGEVRLECDAALGEPDGDWFGYVRRIVRGTATDAVGAVASAEMELPAGPPLAPPAVDPPSRTRAGFAVEFGVPGSSGAWRRWPIALRWREAGAAEWRYDAGAIEEQPEDGGRLATGRFETPWYQLGGTVFEVQLATLRDAREIERPQALRWSEPVRVTTAAAVARVEAEAGHDTISLRWGPDIADLAFAATLVPAPPSEGNPPTIGGWAYDPQFSLVADGPPYGITWTNLCPGTQYFATVRSDIEVWGEYVLPAGLLITTELPPGRAERAPLIEASAGADSITLRWAADACAAHDEYWVEVREYGGDRIAGTYLERDDEVHEFRGLTPGSVYEVAVGLRPVNNWRASSVEAVLETAERAPLPPSADPAPRFAVRYGRERNRWQSAAFEIEPGAGVRGPLEVEWRVGGRRVRRLLTAEKSSRYIHGLPPGRYEFRARGFDAFGRATAWSEPVEAATTPVMSEIESMGYEREHLVVDWRETGFGVPADRHIVEWRIDGSDWERAVAGPGWRAAIPREPFMEAERAQVRVRGVSDEFGEGEPSAEREVPAQRISGWKERLDASGCTDDGSGRLRFAWSLSGGVGPFEIRARPIGLDEDDAGAVVVETAEREGGFEFECADAAERRDGELHAAIEVRVLEYGEQISDCDDPQPCGSISRIEFGESQWGDWEEWDDWMAELPEDYGELPAPGEVSQSVHDTFIRWWLGRAGSSQLKQRLVVRMRGSGDETWVERDLIYGDWPMSWWWIGGLEPGTRYEYAFGRYWNGGSEWSETGVVTTLAEVTGISVSESGGSVVVEWDGQPDAWKYVVRLRAEGRSWWGLANATGGARERFRFAGAGAGGPYEAEVITPPEDDQGQQHSTFILFQGPH